MEQNQEQPKESNFKTEVLKERGKKRPPSTRATRRARTMALVKQVTEMIAVLGPHKAQALQVWIDELKATKKIYHQGVCVDEVPDWFRRHEAAAKIIEYLEGKPRELQIQVSGTSDDFEKMLEIARQVQARESLEKTVQKGKEIRPALPWVAGEDGQQAG